MTRALRMAFVAALLCLSPHVEAADGDIGHVHALMAKGDFQTALSILGQLRPDKDNLEAVEHHQDLLCTGHLGLLDIHAAFSAALAQRWGHSDHQRYVQAICLAATGHTDEAATLFHGLSIYGKKPYPTLYASALLGGSALLSPLAESGEWPAPIALYLQGARTEEEVLSAARAAESTKLRTTRLGEASLVLAIAAERNGHADRAAAHYKRAASTGLHLHNETLWARARLKFLSGSVPPLEPLTRRWRLDGYADATGAFAIRPKFKHTFHNFRNGLAEVAALDCRYDACIIDKQGRFVVPPVYNKVDPFTEAGLAAVERDGKHGFVNLEGRLVIPLQFDGVGAFADGLAPAGIIDPSAKPAKGSFQRRFGPPPEVVLWGYIDVHGEWVIPPKHHGARPFTDGLASVQNQAGEWTLIDRTGTPVGASRSAARVWPREGYSLFVDPETKKVGVVDHRGEWVIPPEYESARSFQNGYAALKDDDGWFFVDTRTQPIGKRRYEKVWMFKVHGVAPVRVDGRWGLIDTSDTFVVEPQYSHMMESGGLFRVVSDDGREAYIDHTGRLVTQSWYPSVHPFKDGHATVDTGAGRGVINTNGEFVVAPGVGNLNDFVEGVFSQDGYATRADRALLNPDDFRPEDRPWIVLNRAQQRLGRLIRDFDRRLAKHAISVPQRVDLPAAEEPRLATLARLEKAHALLEANQLGQLFDDHFTLQRQALAGVVVGSFDVWPVNTENVPISLLKEIDKDPMALERTLDELIRAALRRGGARYADFREGMIYQALIRFSPAMRQQVRAEFVEGGAKSDGISRSKTARHRMIAATTGLIESLKVESRAWKTRALVDGWSLWNGESLIQVRVDEAGAWRFDLARLDTRTWL